MGLKDLRRDLLPTVGGQAVLYHTPRVGEGHKAVVDLIAGKGGGPDGTLLLLAHGGPHVSKDHVGPGGRLLGGADQGEFEVRLAGGKCEHLGVRVVAGGAGHRYLHAALQAAHDEGVGHVVAIPDVAQLQSLQGGLVLPDGHQVGQHLAGVTEVGQAVDDGDVGVTGQGFHLLLMEGADHDAVAVAGQDPGGVLDGLAPADLALLAGQEQSVSAQLVHSSLKGDPGPGGVLLKNHGQSLAPEIVVDQTVLLAVFQLVSGVEDLDDVLLGQIQQLE